MDSKPWKLVLFPLALMAFIISSQFVHNRQNPGRSEINQHVSQESKELLLDQNLTNGNVVEENIHSLSVGDVLGQECKRYEKRFEAFANSLQDGQLNQDEFRNNFYRFVTYPAKHHCKNLQRFGGRWIANRAWDGQKFACLDNFDKESLCIIYSFGLNRDWSFEQTFANLGCQVFGYDHTIKFPPLGKIISPNFTIYGLGVDKASHDQFTSLQDAMKKHNHEKSYIKYIKADIEGAELKVLPEWISSGILEHVEQIGFEFHIRAGNIRKFAQIIVDLKQQGFHLISFDPNAFVGLTNHQYQCFEVVFKKLEGNCFDF